MLNESTDKLDLVGLSCPQPIMHTRKKVYDLSKGDTLLVKASDPSFSIDLGVFIRQSSHTLLESWSKDGIGHYLIRV